ncbi:PREDICTED: uncharacterized protein LOC108510357, partial [Lepidothrix coronata]|uniref:Uncharacterized protein LOC108510357 n=1 Tax=Lepidothrix coronata TaxID=321398 RepID=A0A6J0JB41_9PASS
PRPSPRRKCPQRPAPFPPLGPRGDFGDRNGDFGPPEVIFWRSSERFGAVWSRFETFPGASVSGPAAIFPPGAALRPEGVALWSFGDVTSGGALAVPARLVGSGARRTGVTLRSGAMAEDIKAKLERYKTAPFDSRFPNQNQTKNCWQNYLGETPKTPKTTPKTHLGPPKYTWEPETPQKHPKKL